MSYSICYILGLNAAFALLLALIYEYRKKKQHTVRDYIFTGMCISSAIWSVGFATMFIQTTESGAFVCRAIGIAGAIMFMLSAQAIVNVVPAINKIYHIVFDSIASLGIILYFPAVQYRQASFVMTPYGMTYIYNPTIINFLLYAYLIITGADVLAVILWMIFKARRKRSNAFGKSFLVVEIMIFIGAYFDLLLPAIGYPAIPGSVITQFWGVIVVWSSMYGLDRAVVSVSNMSNYLYDSLATPVVIFTPDLDLQIVNDSAAEFLGVTTEELVKNPRKVTYYFDITREDCYREQYATFTAQLPCKTNMHPCDLFINRIVDKYRDCIGFIMSINDMLEHVEAMEKLEIAKQSADAANRAKTAFLAHMSHEIRTPMNAIMGFSELALTEQISPAAAEDIRNIRDAAGNLLGIINDILDISKIESGKLELVCDKYNPTELLESICSMVDIRAKSKKLKFTVDIPEPLPKIMYGDRTRIREIIVNLLSNAVKYTHKGTISLSVRPVERFNNTMTLGITVTDTGIGIKPEAIGLLFEAFNRVDEVKNSSIEGTGLGLAIVKSYIELMDGTIDVTSTYGEGSTFYVTIPQIVVDASPVSFSDASGKGSSKVSHLTDSDFSRLNILVVDDNMVNRVLITKTLEKYKVKCEAVDSGTAAIEKCRSCDSYDIIFMDQMMPVMDGVEAMKIIRRDFPAYAPRSANRIIALTANAIVGVREELIKEGFDDYLEKPIDFGELERVLKM